MPLGVLGEADWELNAVQLTLLDTIIHQTNTKNGQNWDFPLCEKLGNSLLERPVSAGNFDRVLKKRKATITWTVAFFSYKKTLKGKTFVMKVY